MAEAAGLILGVLGLAGLFTTCTDCLELVQLGRAYAWDYELLQTKFEAQKLRFLIWGEVFGFTKARGYDTRLDNPSVRPTVIRIMNNIHRLFSDEEQLAKRYGLRIDDGMQQPSGRVVFRETYQRFQARIHRTNRQATLGTKAKWAITDQRKFSQLVQDLKDLLDLLEDISRSLQLLQRNDDLMAAEVESISDPGSLRLLEQALSDNERLSDTASRRLRLIEEAPFNVSFKDGQAVASMSSVEPSFHTAPSQQQPFREDAQHETILPVNEVLGSEVPQNQRMARDFQQLAIRSKETKAREVSSRSSIDFGTIGRRLKRLKEIDILHTKDVIARHSSKMSAEEKRIIMILEKLLQSTPTNFVSLAPIGDDLLELLGRIEGPPGSPYETGIFHVQISILGDFPFSPPACRFLTRIYHPNIDHAGKICLDFLEPQNWTMELMNLESILLSICALLDQPNVDDPLVPEIASTYILDKPRFDDIARQFTEKYAQEHADVKLSKVAAFHRSTSSWQTVFLEERLRVMQTRAAALIGWLERGPASQELRIEVVSSYKTLLYELCLQLHSLNTIADGRSKFSSLFETQYTEVENFFDACAKAFFSLAKDRVWIQAFPQLITLKHNDATRGTGNPDLQKFIDQEAMEQSRRELREAGYGLPPGLFDETDAPKEQISENHKETLDNMKALIRHAKWLNGDATLIPSERKPMVTNADFVPYHIVFPESESSRQPDEQKGSA